MISDIYDVNTVALALNLSEIIYNSFPESTDEIYNQLFSIAWGISFENDIDHQKLDKSINYYVSSHDEIIDDPYSQPGYSHCFPDDIGEQISKKFNQRIKR